MPSAAAAGNDMRHKVIKALENPAYDWRTVPGIAAEVGAPEEDVLEVLQSMKDVVIRTEDSEGRPIFTTRQHYQQTHGFGDRLLSALSDRVVS
jgi:hypothetical protein